MNEEFKTLLAAYNDTHSTWMGAFGLHTAVYQHLGMAGQRAADTHLAELQAAWEQAQSALNAHMQARRQFDTAAYEAQQRSIAHLHAA